jgi:N-acetylmuramoyl-L-alanine amidase
MKNKSKFTRRIFCRNSFITGSGLILLPKLLLAQSKSTAQLLNIRLGKQPNDKERIVFDLTNQIPYQAFYLTSPERIVIDLENIKKTDFAYKKISSEIIEKIRIGEFSNKTRIVLELNKTSLIDTHNMLAPYSSKSNWRLYFDISQASNNQFSQAISNKTIITQNTKQIEVSPTINKNTKPNGYTKKSTPSIVKKEENEIKTIVIDPGHGGKDPGAIGRSGSYEKNIVLLASQTLKKELEKLKGFKVRMTRKNDTYITLGNRVKHSIDNDADLFISMHADSHPTKSTIGCSVYTLAEKAVDSEAAKLARRENAEKILASGSDFNHYEQEVKNILSSLHQRRVKSDSATFANNLLTNLRRSGIKTLGRAHRSAPFAVLKSPKPSVLVEMGYLTNKKEEGLLRQKWYRDKFAKIIVNTINEFEFSV